MNPAVTIGLLVTKNIALIDSIYYIVAQVIGACLGSLCLFLCLGNPAVAIGGLGATAPGLGVSYMQAMFAEFLGTFFLMMVIMGVAVAIVEVVARAKEKKQKEEIETKRDVFR